MLTTPREPEDATAKWPAQGRAYDSRSLFYFFLSFFLTGKLTLEECGIGGGIVYAYYLSKARLGKFIYVQ